MIPQKTKYLENKVSVYDISNAGKCAEKHEQKDRHDTEEQTFVTSYKTYNRVQN